MNFLIRFLFVTLIFFAATPCHAHFVPQKSDLFYDLHWVNHRPSVPSDRDRSSDMFAPIPVFYNKNADMYDHVKPPYTYGRDDMFPHHALGLTRPQHVLTIDPPLGWYNAR